MDDYVSRKMNAVPGIRKLMDFPWCSLVLAFVSFVVKKDLTKGLKGMHKGLDKGFLYPNC
jgi:hypothetical protein